MRDRVSVRWMLRRDLPDVVAIEALSFEFPWSEEDFVNCLRRRNCLGMVAEDDGAVVGFMVYELKKTSICVLNFCVSPGARRCGVGLCLVRELLRKLENSPIQKRITLEVRETNLPGQLFFRAAGFRAVAVLRGLYEEYGGEDGYLFVLRERRGEPLPLALAQRTHRTEVS